MHLGRLRNKWCPPPATAQRPGPEFILKDQKQQIHSWLPPDVKICVRVRQEKGQTGVGGVGVEGDDYIVLELS